MEDGSALTPNGFETADDTMLLARWAGPSDLVEPRANLFVIPMFDAPMRDRGWPAIEDIARIVRPNAGGLYRVRAAIREIMLFASNSASEFVRLIEHKRAAGPVARGHECRVYEVSEQADVEASRAVTGRAPIARASLLLLP
jgi:hypothetical protein